MKILRMYAIQLYRNTHINSARAHVNDFPQATTAKPNRLRCGIPKGYEIACDKCKLKGLYDHHALLHQSTRS